MQSLLDAYLDTPEGGEWWASASDAEKLATVLDWEQVARPEQIAPPGEWLVWLVLAGRGWGKTRCGAEWVRSLAENNPQERIALVAPTAADARDVMVEGESGILAISHPHKKPLYEPSKRRLTWPNGALATLYSADEPERLRGPQHTNLWGDEVAAWRYPDAWDMGMFGLRLGDRPRACVTTTPKPKKLIRELIKANTTAITRGSTYDNRSNLADAFFRQVVAKYEGTTLGRQELHAEILDDLPGALWVRARIDELRVKVTPRDLARVVVAIDPAVTSAEGSDETGIIVTALGSDRQGYVLADLSCRESPDKWARIAVEAYRKYDADRIVAEVNNGGDLVESVIRTVDQLVPYKAVHASRGKRVRAEPVAALYEQGRVHHVGAHDELEDQLCSWLPGEGASPDRLDALVWGLTECCLDDAIGWIDHL